MDRILNIYEYLLSDEGAMENVGDFSTAFGTPTINEQSIEQIHGGSFSRKLGGDSSFDGVYSAVATTVIGSFYECNGWIYVVSLTNLEIRIMAARSDNWAVLNYGATATTGSWIKINFVCQAETTSTRVLTVLQGTGPAVWHADDITIKQITNAALANGVPVINSFGNPVVKYKQGNSEANCDGDAWNAYVDPFVTGGWIKVRIECA